MLRRPWQLFSTRWPWTSLLYLVIEVAAGWVTWVAMATVIMLPGWAMVWSRLERRLVRLTGRPAVAPPAHETRVTWRHITLSFVTALVGLVGTFVGAVIVAGLLVTMFAPLSGTVFAEGSWRLNSPLAQAGAVLSGCVLAYLVLWLLTAAANGLARISAALLSPLTEELQQQVDRLVSASVRAQDQLVLERRHLERQLHDGAQLHLSVAGARLALLECDLDSVLESDQRARLLAAVHDVRECLDAAVDAVRSTAQGLVPRVLLDEGLGAAVEAMVAGLPVATDVRCDVPRTAEDVEASLYLIATEATTNAMKHSRCECLAISARRDGDELELLVEDDGIGGATASGAGILGMAVRARTLGGALRLTSPAGGPTVIVVRVPWRESA